MHLYPYDNQAVHESESQKPLKSPFDIKVENVFTKKKRRKKKSK